MSYLEDHRIEMPDVTWTFLENHHSEECVRIEREWAESDLTRDLLVDHIKDLNLHRLLLASRDNFVRAELHRLWQSGKYHMELVGQ